MRHQTGNRLLTTVTLSLATILHAGAQQPRKHYEATWESLEQNYTVPEWFKDAKFGIFIHWGVYSVPATGSEWYPKHMYNGLAETHRQRWGDQRDFGYKDFIPMFKAEKFNPDEWAQLFRRSGARYVIPTAEHHDGFAMYDSRLTRWNALQMGPKRDIIGELAKAVRAEGMKFGVSNHRVEHWDFMYPERLSPDSTDLFLPEYDDFYGPPQRPTDASGMGPSDPDTLRHPQDDRFLNEWQERVYEIIDRYRPDLLYFDNGINYRSMDPWKLRIAQYYYNSAENWGKEVSIQSKSKAYLAGSILDFERESRAPKELFTSAYWQVDDPIGNKFGYIEGLKLQSAEGIIRNLVENISKNGNLCLNISPKGDGSIPQEQQKILLRIGQWLDRYGEGVYGSRAYSVFGEGPNIKKHPSKANIRFTCKGESEIYAFVIRWDGTPFHIRTLSHCPVTKVECLYEHKQVGYKQTPDGLLIDAQLSVDDPVVVFKITLAKRPKVLFIGDSVTDGGWGNSGGHSTPSGKRNRRDLNHIYGHGYMELCASHCQSLYPKRDIQFFNRGISGNTLQDLYDRWQPDALALNPDVISILIGTNDIDKHLREHPGEDFDFYHWGETYKKLLSKARQKNPDVKFVLGAPFIAKVGRIGQAGDYNKREEMIGRCAETIRNIARDFNAIYLPYNEMFAKLSSEAPRPDYWIWDGIHPTPAGHRRMADLWLNQVTPVIKKIKK